VAVDYFSVSIHGAIGSVTAAQTAQFCANGVQLYCQFVDPTGGLVIGLIAGVACYFGATSLKHAFKYDDSLDAFGVHGIGGIVGAICARTQGTGGYGAGHEYRGADRMRQ